MNKLDVWFVEQSREYRRLAENAARAFEAACKSGSYDAVLDAADNLGQVPDDWRLAMLKAGRLTSVSSDVKHAFLVVWVTHKRIPLSVGYRPTTAKALRVLLPRTQISDAITIYRGCTDLEHNRRAYSFSWTTSLEVAATFAEQWGEQGVILETKAEPAAVLHVRSDVDDEIGVDGSAYLESEVIVDPYKLGSVRRAAA